MDFSSKAVTELINLALEEDCAKHDITTRSIFTSKRKIDAVIIAKEANVVCGLPLIPVIFKKLGAKFRIKFYAKDGQSVKKNSRVALIKTDIISMYAAERVILNFLSRLSAVSTLTKQFADAVKSTHSKIYDTRKTTPGYRDLEKYAVRCGGGCNHRMNLSDMALIKDNHLAAARFDDLKKAVSVLKQMKIKCEIEVDDFKMLTRMLALKPEVIMLDNFNVNQMSKALKYISSVCGKGGRPAVEVSGGVKLANIRKIAKLGVDRISVGAITHSAGSVDFSMEVL